jgi:hypothetical protein
LDRWLATVTELTNYTKLSKQIIHRADDLANLSPYNLVVREIMTDFKPTYIPAKIVISLVVTISNYIKVHIMVHRSLNIVITNQVQIKVAEAFSSNHTHTRTEFKIKCQLMIISNKSIRRDVRNDHCPWSQASHITG